MTPDTVIQVAHDTTFVAVDTLGHVVQVIVPPPVGRWWTSPLLQTLLGGALAIAGGALTPVILEWQKRGKLRTQLYGALDTLKSHLLETWARVQEDKQPTGRILYLVLQIKALREALDRDKNELSLLPTAVGREVLVVYEIIDPIVERVRRHVETLHSTDEADTQSQLMPAVSLRMTRDGLLEASQHCARVRDLVKAKIGFLRWFRRNQTT